MNDKIWKECRGMIEREEGGKDGKKGDGKATKEKQESVDKKGKQSRSLRGQERELGVLREMVGRKEGKDKREKEEGSGGETNKE